MTRAPDTEATESDQEDGELEILLLPLNVAHAINCAPLDDLKEIITLIVSKNCLCESCKATFTYGSLVYQQRAGQELGRQLGEEITAICQARAPGHTKH